MVAPRGHYETQAGRHQTSFKKKRREPRRKRKVTALPWSTSHHRFVTWRSEAVSTRATRQMLTLEGAGALVPFFEQISRPA